MPISSRRSVHGMEVYWVPRPSDTRGRPGRYRAEPRRTCECPAGTPVGRRSHEPGHLVPAEAETGLAVRLGQRSRPEGATGEARVALRGCYRLLRG